MHFGEEQIKFADRGLFKISDLLEYNDDNYFIRVNNIRYKIKRNSSATKAQRHKEELSI